MGEAVDPRPEATRLGSYEILRKLARGGMAELFLARTVGPEGFEKLVVLKKILPHFAENPKFVRLFLDEARLAATLDHPHIAHVYDMGKVDGHYFFTMEYVHGQDVRTTLRRTARYEAQLPIDHAVQIAHAVAAALHYAHERRKPDGTLLEIVHRDVSPSNMLISYDGAIKLVDFGVAKAATSSVKTRTGTLKGKIAYMSPEQARGSPIDRRSDIFSLGIVLWEMVTTSRLFKGENDLATIQLIVNSNPTPPSALRPECPAELERIILKALAVELDQRYQTAEELQLDLEEFAREHKLKQSSVVLRAHMQELFAEEIRAWMHAQASGVTLTDHVVSASGVEMTTPVSENELSFVSEDDGPDEDEDDDDSILHAPVTARRPATSDVPVVQQAPVRIEPTPLPLAVVPIGASTGPARAIQHTPSGPLRAPTLPPMLVHPPSGQIAMPPGMAAFPNEQPSHAGFPIAPREWRDAASPAHDALRQHRAKRLWIGGMLTLALVVVIALAAGGRSSTARGATDELRPEPVETTQRTGTIGEPAKPANDDPAKASDPKPSDTNAIAKPAEPAETTKPSDTNAITKPVEPMKPSDTKPPADTAKASDTPAPVDTTKPDTKPTDTQHADTTKPADTQHVDTKPSVKPTVKAEPAHKPATKPQVARPADSTKAKPKPRPPVEKKKPDAAKPPKPEPAEYDPNSALPPP